MPASCCERPQVSKGVRDQSRVKERYREMSREERLRALIEPWLGAEHLELDDLEISGADSALTLRVLVDGEGGVDLDRLAEVNDGISRILDAEDPIEGRYRLEVSSPGLERSLRSSRHFQKSVGREVRAKLVDGTHVAGVIASADETGFTLNRAEGDELAVGYDTVASAKTVFRWEKNPKPGKKK